MQAFRFIISEWLWYKVSNYEVGRIFPFYGQWIVILRCLLFIHCIEKASKRKVSHCTYLHSKMATAASCTALTFYCVIPWLQVVYPIFYISYTERVNFPGMLSVLIQDVNYHLSISRIYPGTDYMLLKPDVFRTCETIFSGTHHSNPNAVCNVSRASTHMATSANFEVISDQRVGICNGGNCACNWIVKLSVFCCSGRFENPPNSGRLYNIT